MQLVQLVVLASPKVSDSLMRAESIPSMVRLVVLPSLKASPSLMRAESVPSMVRLVVLPSPKALLSLMRAESVPSLVRLVVPQRCGCSKSSLKGVGDSKSSSKMWLFQKNS